MSKIEEVKTLIIAGSGLLNCIKEVEPFFLFFLGGALINSLKS
jgi:hypothetical protein